MATQWLLYVLFTLCLGWVAQAWISVALARHLRQRINRKPQREQTERYRPSAVVIVPFKGVDPGLCSNLDGLFQQDYHDYRLLLVVDSPNDEVVSELEAAIARHPQRHAEIIVAGPAEPDEGQKVHNLRYVLTWMREHGVESEVWAFADSDAVPGPEWLASLAGHLYSPDIGVTTGYRWLIPVADETGRAHPASHLASLLNASAAAFLGRARYHMPWGGSMAMRSADAIEAGLEDAWRGTVSDDYTVHRLVRGLGKRAYFVTDCFVRSPVDLDWRSFWEFAVRQYVITRVFEPKVFYQAFVLPWVYVLSFFIVWVGLYLDHARGGWWWAWLVLAVQMPVAHQLRARTRAAAIRDAFGDETVEQLKTTLWLDRWATPLWMLANAVVMLRAVTTRTITWRRNRYRLDGPNRTVLLSGG